MKQINNKVIWAVDPMQNPSEARRMIAEIKLWTKNLNFVVQPVSVISNRALNLPVEFGFPMTERLEEIGRHSVKRYFKKISFKNSLPPVTLTVAYKSKRKMAAELVRFAERENAKLIFATSRSKSAWFSLGLGGFAETLIAISPIPILITPPVSQQSRKVHSILFPTDFSDESRQALGFLSPLAKALGAKVVLFNQVETPAVYASELSLDIAAQSATFQTMLEGIEQSRRKKAQKFSDFLFEQDIENQIIVKNQKRSLSFDALEAAQKNKVELIALYSRSGPFTQSTIGSLGRDLLNVANCPILIFNKSAFKKSAHKDNFFKKRGTASAVLSAHAEAR